MNLSVITGIVYLYQRCATVSTTAVTTVTRPTVTAENGGVCAYIIKKKTWLVFLALHVVDSRALSVWCCTAIYGMKLQYFYYFALTIIPASVVNKCQKFPLFTMLMCLALHVN